MNSETPFIKTRKIADKVNEGQDRNRTWWENAPMTYISWDNTERLLKDAKDFEYVNQQYLETNPFLDNKFNFNSLKSKKVLEIGCGAGSASVLFAKNGAEVTAVDITEQAIQMIKKNAQYNNVKLNAIKQDAEKLSFSDETFDYVYSWGVLHHSQNTVKAFSEVSRVLKKGGQGLIMVYNRNSIRYYIKGLKWLLLRGKIFKGYNLEKIQSFYTDGYYHRHFTSNELKRSLASKGLISDKISITHMKSKCFPYIPHFLDEGLKLLFGWLLISEFHK